MVRAPQETKIGQELPEEQTPGLTLEENDVRSPVTGGKADHIDDVEVSHIVSLYRENLGFDVEKHFLGVSRIGLFKCRETGYEFFYPFSVAGNPDYYSDLYRDSDNSNWAYQKNKWEYGFAREVIGKIDRLLDIGCGGGEFLAELGDRAKCFIGLETSPYGRESSRAKGLTVLDETIEFHANQNPGAYDVITAFQVLEHVTDVKRFLLGCIEALKPGGRLIIAVPNNDGFVGLNFDLLLNLPPHHMGRWRRGSLTAIAQQFELELIGIEYEPLARENLGWYQSTVEKKFLPKSRLARSAYYRLGVSRMFRRYLEENRKTIHGHTILAVYQKI